MKIPIDESNSPLQERDKKYLALLEGDPNFENLIVNARNKCRIKTLYKNFATPQLLRDSTEEAKIIVALYNLPNSWVNSLSYFIVTGKFSSPGEGIMMSGKQYDEYLRLEPLSIEIYEQVSFDELVRYIFQNKDHIQPYLKNLPRKRPSIKNVELKAEIFKLWSSGKKPKRICDLLAKKYEKDQEIYEKLIPQNINRWVSDLRNALEGYPIKKSLKSRRKSS